MSERNILVIAGVVLLAVVAIPVLWPAAMLAYYDVRLLMKGDEIERCLHIVGSYRTFGNNVVCVDIRR